METDYQKLLNACKEYRAKLDEALEANNELSERLSTIPDEVWSKADLVKQIHQAYAERDELQKENTKLKDALKEEKIDRSLDGWNEAAIINDLKRENAELKETARKHVAAYYELLDENSALKQRIHDDNKAYGCELLDPSGTIWDHAQKLQKENAALKEALDAQSDYQRELRADRDRLDWLSSYRGMIERWEGDWYCEGQMFSSVRSAIDAAMKEGKV